MPLLVSTTYTLSKDIFFSALVIEYSHFLIVIKNAKEDRITF
jgi:hypothetical protein